MHHLLSAASRVPYLGHVLPETRGRRLKETSNLRLLLGFQQFLGAFLALRLQPDLERRGLQPDLRLAMSEFRYGAFLKQKRNVKKN